LRLKPAISSNDVQLDLHPVGIVQEENQMRQSLYKSYFDQQYRLAVRKVRKKIHEAEPLKWEDFLTVREMIELDEITPEEATKLLEAVRDFVSRFRQSEPDWDSLPRSFTEMHTRKSAESGIYNYPGANSLSFVLGKYDKNAASGVSKLSGALAESEFELIRNAQGIVQMYRDWLKSRATTLATVSTATSSDQYANSLEKYYLQLAKVADRSESPDSSFHKRIRFFADNSAFQRQTELIRERWDIDAEYPVGIDQTTLNLRDYLDKYVFKTRIKVLEYQQLLNDIQVEVFEQVKKLNETDLGLVVCAICFGLRPEDIENEDRLKVIMHLAHQTAPREPLLSTSVDDWEKFAGLLLSLAMMVNEFRKIHTDPDDIFDDWLESTGFDFLDNQDHPIAQWVAFAKSFCTSLGIDFNNKDDLLEAIEIISGEPDSPSIDDVTVQIRIDQNTTQENVKGLWNKVKANRIWLIDQETKLRWYQARQNAMSTELARLMINRKLSPGEAIIDYCHKHPDCGLDPDSLSDVERVKKMKHRYQSRQNGTK